MNLRQRIWLTVVVAGNLLLWVIPSDVVEEIARDRHTLLGRYSKTHFYWILAAAVLTPISLYVDWSRGAEYRRRLFRVLVATFVFLVGLAGLDFLMRTKDRTHYVRERFAYHRPPRFTVTVPFEDRPQADRTLLRAPAGFGTVACTLTVDDRGYRNPETMTQADIVILGDSFAEGSGVSDDHVWSARLRNQYGRSVCNLGMSGYDPLHYLESLRHPGLTLHPEFVVCLLYEGNDFRSARADAKRLHPSLSMRLEDYVDRSPVLSAVDGFLVSNLEPINSRRRVTGLEVLDWLPLVVASGTTIRYFNFEPKQLRDLLEDRASFALDRHWLNPRGHLEEMNRLAASIGARFLLVYAPTKAHVVLPLTGDRLSDDKVRAFTAISYKKTLPVQEGFVRELIRRSGDREQVVDEWSEQAKIPFLSLTDPLRTATAEGIQTYYTYDQHWSPDGHGVVADAVQEWLTSIEGDPGLPTLPETSTDPAREVLLRPLVKPSSPGPDPSSKP